MASDATMDVVINNRSYPEMASSSPSEGGGSGTSLMTLTTSGVVQSLASLT